MASLQIFYLRPSVKQCTIQSCYLDSCSRLNSYNYQYYDMHFIYFVATCIKHLPETKDLLL